MEPMGLIAWLIVGGLAGWLANMVIPSGLGLISTIIAGIVGGFIGGFLFHAIGEPGMTGFSIWSVFVAFIGAVVLLYVIRLLNGRRGSAVKQ
jgi:uncharacterized membrane protein YeaQ/YmgE (transglycosylase-associated protein family)